MWHVNVQRAKVALFNKVKAGEGALWATSGEGAFPFLQQFLSTDDE
jgi:hypothetical protein